MKFSSQANTQTMYFDFSGIRHTHTHTRHSRGQQLFPEHISVVVVVEKCGSDKVTINGRIRSVSTSMFTKFRGFVVCMCDLIYLILDSASLFLISFFKTDQMAKIETMKITRYFTFESSHKMTNAFVIDSHRFTALCFAFFLFFLFSLF